MHTNRLLFLRDGGTYHVHTVTITKIEPTGDKWGGVFVTDTNMPDYPRYVGGREERGSSEEMRMAEVSELVAARVIELEAQIADASRQLRELLQAEWEKGETATGPKLSALSASVSASGQALISGR